MTKTNSTNIHLIITTMKKAPENLVTTTIRLRTLTLKSVLNFGMHKSRTVEEIMKLEEKNYLRWLYYNLINITFTPNVLEALNITATIQKPGNDIEAWKERQRFYKAKYTTKKSWIETFKPNKAIKKDKIKIQISTSQNKGLLQRYNQGHR